MPDSPAPTISTSTCSTCSSGSVLVTAAAPQLIYGCIDCQPATRCGRAPRIALMSTRAGTAVTGTEVLTGRVADRNGPWLAEQLRVHGVDVAHTVVVGDRRADLLAALGFLAGTG